MHFPTCVGVNGGILGAKGYRFKNIISLKSDLFLFFDLFEFKIFCQIFFGFLWQLC